MRPCLDYCHPAPARIYVHHIEGPAEEIQQGCDALCCRAQDDEAGVGTWWEARDVTEPPVARDHHATLLGCVDGDGLVCRTSREGACATPDIIASLLQHHGDAFRDVDVCDEHASLGGCRQRNDLFADTATGVSQGGMDVFSFERWHFL